MAADLAVEAAVRNLAAYRHTAAEVAAIDTAVEVVGIVIDGGLAIEIVVELVGLVDVVVGVAAVGTGRAVGVGSIRRWLVVMSERNTAVVVEGQEKWTVDKDRPWGCKGPRVSLRPLAHKIHQLIEVGDGNCHLR